MIIKWPRHLFPFPVMYNQHCNYFWLLLKIMHLLMQSTHFVNPNTPHICSTIHGLWHQWIRCMQCLIRPPDLPHDVYHAGLFVSPSPVCKHGQKDERHICRSRSALRQAQHNVTSNRCVTQAEIKTAVQHGVVHTIRHGCCDEAGRQRALLADETRQRLCCSQLPVWKRTALFVGCFDTPSHFVIWDACCSSDHMHTLHSKSVTSAAWQVGSQWDNSQRECPFQYTVWVQMHSAPSQNNIIWHHSESSYVVFFQFGKKLVTQCHFRNCPASEQRGLYIETGTKDTPCPSVMSTSRKLIVVFDSGS